MKNNSGDKSKFCCHRPKTRTSLVVRNIFDESLGQVVYQNKGLPYSNTELQTSHKKVYFKLNGFRLNFRAVNVQTLPFLYEPFDLVWSIWFEVLGYNLQDL